MSLVVIGANHRTAPLELLERMVIRSDDLPKLLHALSEAPDVSEAVVLATCNRTEVYLVAERFHPAYAQVRDFFSDLTFLAPDEFSDSLYTHYDEHALRHLFEVSAGLDSAVTGEHEILGQVKSAWERAQEEGTARRSMNMVFRHALEVGKRARNETSIAHHVTSVSQAAVILAGRRFAVLDDHRVDAVDSSSTYSDPEGRVDASAQGCELEPCIGASAAKALSGRRAVVVGAGSMAKGMASFLAAADVADLVIANRTLRTAESLAEMISVQNSQLPIRAVAMSELSAVISTADVVLSAARTDEHVITTDTLQVDARGGVSEGRRGSLLIVDVGLPRNVDPALAMIDGVDLLDMDDISRLTDAGIAVREAQVGAVSSIVDEEIERFENLVRAREAAPVVTSLRSLVESLRVAELDRQSRKYDTMTDDQSELVDRVTRAVVAKLLHEPSVRLRNAAGTARGDRLAESIRDLFDLDGQ